MNELFEERQANNPVPSRFSNRIICDPFASVGIINGAVLISYKTNTYIFNVKCSKKVSTLIPFICMLGFEDEPYSTEKMHTNLAQLMNKYR